MTAKSGHTENNTQNKHTNLNKLRMLTMRAKIRTRFGIDILEDEIELKYYLKLVGELWEENFFVTQLDEDTMKKIIGETYPPIDI